VVLSSLAVKYSPLSLGDLERQVQARLQNRPASISYLIFVSDEVSRSLNSLVEEEPALYDLIQSKTWYSHLPSARGEAVLFADIVRHITVLSSADTKFIGRCVLRRRH
jgi:hypothetical protein